MKPLALFFVLVIAAPSTTTAQDATPPAVAEGPPGVVLLKLKWSRAVAVPRGSIRTPFDASLGAGQFPSPSQRVPAPFSPLTRSSNFRYVYQYTAKIRNDGAKEIKAVLWDYVLSDPDSKRELGRHRFYNREKISAREDETLRGKSPFPPSRVVTAKGLEKDKRSPFEERFEIRCVLYTDGTLWSRPSARQSDCDGLLRREKDHKDRRNS